MGGMLRSPNLAAQRDIEAETGALGKQALPIRPPGWQQGSRGGNNAGPVPIPTPVGGPPDTRGYLPGSQDVGAPPPPGAMRLGPDYEGAYKNYMDQLAEAYGSAIGADVEKVEVTNPERFGAVVNAVNLLKNEKIGQGQEEIDAGNAAFLDVFREMGIEVFKGGIAPGLSLMLTEKQLKESQPPPQSQFEFGKTAIQGFKDLIPRTTNLIERAVDPRNARPFVSGPGGGGLVNQELLDRPIDPERWAEFGRANTALINPLTPGIPESFVGDSGGFNKVLRETIRDMSSPGMIALTLAFPGATQAAAGFLGRMAAKKGADALSRKALNAAVKLIDDGTYHNALKMEIRGEFGANLLINALTDQGVEMNLAQQIGFGLIGGVAGVAAPPVAARGIKAAAKSTGLDDWSGINLSDLDRPSPDWSPADIEAHKQRLIAGYDRPSAAGAAATAAREPFDVIDAGFEQRYIDLAERTARAEKTPERPMDPDELALYQEGRNWKEYSRSRGYTEAEINDQQAFLDMFEEGKRLGYTEDQLAGIAYEGTIKGRGLGVQDQEARWGPAPGENVAFQESNVRPVAPGMLEPGSGARHVDLEATAVDAQGRYRDVDEGYYLEGLQRDPERAFGNTQADVDRSIAKLEGKQPPPTKFYHPPRKRIVRDPVTKKETEVDVAEQTPDYTETRNSKQIRSNVSRNGNVRVVEKQEAYQQSGRRVFYVSVLVRPEDDGKKITLRGKDFFLKEGTWRPIAEFQLQRIGVDEYTGASELAPTRYNYTIDLETIDPDLRRLGYGKDADTQRNALNRPYGGFFQALDKIIDLIEAGKDADGNLLPKEDSTFVGVYGDRMHGTQDTLAYNFYDIRHGATKGTIGPVGEKTSAVKLPEAEKDRRAAASIAATERAGMGPASKVVRNADDVRIGLARSFPNNPIEQIDAWIEVLKDRHKVVQSYEGGNRAGPARAISEDEWIQERFAGFNTDGLITMDDGRLLSPSLASGIDGVTFHVSDPGGSGFPAIARAVISTNYGKLPPKAVKAGTFYPLAAESMTPTQRRLLSEVETMWHELGHIIRRDLYDMDANSMAVLSRFVGISQKDIWKDFEGQAPPQWGSPDTGQIATRKMFARQWTPGQEEKFARGFVSYLANPERFHRAGLHDTNKKMGGVFARVLDWLRRVPMHDERLDDAGYMVTVGREPLSEVEFRAFDEIFYNWDKTGVSYSRLVRWREEGRDPFIDEGKAKDTGEKLPPAHLAESPAAVQFWPDGEPQPVHRIEADVREDYVGVEPPDAFTTRLGAIEGAALPEGAGAPGSRLNDRRFRGADPGTPSETGNTGVKVLDDIVTSEVPGIGATNLDSYERVPHSPFFTSRGDTGDLGFWEVRSKAPGTSPSVRSRLHDDNLSFEVRAGGLENGQPIALIGLRRIQRSRGTIGPKVWEMHVRGVAPEDSLLIPEIQEAATAIKLEYGERIETITNVPEAPSGPSYTPTADDPNLYARPDFAGRIPEGGILDDDFGKAPEGTTVIIDGVETRLGPDGKPIVTGRGDVEEVNPYARANEEIKLAQDRDAQVLQAARLRQTERLGLETGDPVSVAVEKASLQGTAVPFATADRLVRENITPRILDVIGRAGRQTKADIEVRAAAARQGVAVSANVFATSGATGEDLLKRGTNVLKATGEKPLSAYERAPLRGQGADPANALSEADMHLIFESINRNPRMRPYTKLNTAKAVWKLVDGEHVTRFDIQRLRAVFGKEITGSLFDNRGFKRKLFDEIMDILGIPRLLLATMDFSAPLRQALLPLGGHPIRWAKTFGPAWKGAISGKWYDAQRAARHEKANHLLFTQSASSDLPENQRGLGIYETDPDAGGVTGSEEAFLSQFLKRLPDRAGRIPVAGNPAKFILNGVGKVAGYPIRFSERGWSGFLDQLRYGLMDDAWESWKHTNDSNGNPSFILDEATGDMMPTAQTLKDGRDLARYINISTGRGDLGMLEGAAAPLANIFFSPRLMAARFEAPYELIRWDRSKRVKNHVYRDFAGMIGGGSTVLGLAAVAGATVELNPTSSDFGRMQVGNTRVDIWGGFQPLVRTMARAFMGQRKSTGTGRTVDLSLVEVLEEFWLFFRAKMAPVVGFTTDVVAGGNFTGDEINFEGNNMRREMFARFAPLILQDLVEAWEHDGLTGIALAAPSFFGTSVIAYQGIEEVSRRDYKYPEGHPNADRPGRKGLANVADPSWSMFEDLPPFLQDNAIYMNKFEGSRKESEFSAQIEKLDQDYWQTLVGLVDDPDKSDSVKVSGFFDAGNTRADTRAGAFEAEYGEFETSTDEPKDDNAKAMRSYYDLVAYASGAGNKEFLNEAFEDGLAEYMESWTPEQRQWVQANTNNRIIPIEMYNILPDKQRLRYYESHLAREALVEVWSKDEDEVYEQMASRIPNITETREQMEAGDIANIERANANRIRDGLPPLGEAATPGTSGTGGARWITGEEMRQNRKALPPRIAVPTVVPDANQKKWLTGEEVRATQTAGGR